VEFHEIVPDTAPSDLEDLLERARTFGAVVIAAALKPAAWHRFGLLPGQSRFVAEMIRRVPVVLVALGSPRLFTDFPDAAVAICTWSDVQPSQEALVETLVRILGESPEGA
jgi:hypothetical protein